MLKIFPNPVHNQATIILDSRSPLPFQVYMFNGKKVSEGILDPGSNTLDLSSLSHGIYMLKCAQMNAKIVKL
ncbi:MAG: T9SS type A sorting domain-containing protein [Bacteroidales bacterium]|nr:T9SS type A sorting domain-containing protein [Bacteroidales bacterium]